ncbi:RNA polymerase sigma-70 factor [Puteibacter caeruleilacunae]|nr:RNA polymerase sigma-70 factor [Puteibacter caeruleilacunae]
MIVNTSSEIINETLLTQLKEGNEEVFKVIFNCYYDAIVGFCTQFINEREKARGITQEAFLKLWMNRSKIQQYSGIKSFLYTAAKTGCLNTIRNSHVASRYQNAALQQQEKQLNTEILNSYSFDPVEFSELEDKINEIIQNLPEKCRIVFQKSRYNSMKNHEIAKELNISEKAVEGHISRALKILRKQLTPYLPAFLIEMFLSNL